MSRPFLKERSKCVECASWYTPRENESQEQWINRMFCGLSCSVAFRRRTRRGMKHPADVVNALAAREKIVQERLEKVNNRVKDNASVYVKKSRAKKKVEA